MVALVPPIGTKNPILGVSAHGLSVKMENKEKKLQIREGTNIKLNPLMTLSPAIRILVTLKGGECSICLTLIAPLTAKTQASFASCTCA